MGGRPEKTGFGLELERWRLAAGLSQLEVDEGLGKSKGITAQFEVGKLKPPGFELCCKLDVILSLPPGSTWDAAAPERMRQFDEDLWTWHRAELDRARGLHLSHVEELLLDELRAVAPETSESRRGELTPSDALAFDLHWELACMRRDEEDGHASLLYFGQVLELLRHHVPRRWRGLLWRSFRDLVRTVRDAEHTETP